MSKVYRVIDPNGVHYAGKIIAKGETVPINSGPHIDAWLRFKQVEEVKEKPAKGGDSETKK